MIGREHEIVQIQHILEDFIGIERQTPKLSRHSSSSSLNDGDESQGEEPNVGRILLIEGEKGIGKTNLIHQLKQMAKSLRKELKDTKEGEKDESIVIFDGISAHLEQQTPFYSFRTVLYEMLIKFYPSILKIMEKNFPELNEPTPSDALKQGKDGRENEAKESVKDSEFLREIEVRLNQLSGNVAKKKKRNSTMDDYQLDESCLLDELIQVFIDLLKRISSTKRIIIIIEDVHWMDKASWSLIEQIARCVPSFIVMTTRQSLDVEEMKKMRRRGGFETLFLNRMSEEDLHLLLSKRFDINDFEEEIVKIVWKRSEGNPYFASELFNSMLETKLIEIQPNEKFCRISKREAIEEHDLPSTLEAAITCRIDNLPLPLLEVLKAASVIGSNFTEKTLSAILPNVKDRLDQLVHLGLILPPPPPSPLVGGGEPPQAENPIYSFSHITVQEVVYRMITFSQKRSGIKGR